MGFLSPSLSFYHWSVTTEVRWLRKIILLYLVQFLDSVYSNVKVLWQVFSVCFILSIYLCLILIAAKFATKYIIVVRVCFCRGVSCKIYIYRCVEEGIILIYIPQSCPDIDPLFSIIGTSQHWATSTSSVVEYNY